MGSYRQPTFSAQPNVKLRPLYPLFLSATGVSISSTTNIYSGLDLASEIQNGVVINRRLDTLGRNVGFDLGGEYGVAYGYDEFGRFSCVTSTVGTEITGFDYAYLPGTDLIAGMSNSAGQSWSRSFEPNRDLITAVSNFWGASTVSSFVYSNDALGRRTARTDFNGSVVTPNAFGYNLRSEVTNATMGTGTYAYDYDPIGNRITASGPGASSTYSANALNQYTSVADGVTVVPGYDDDGNMTSYGPWTFTWDAENRLANVFSNGVLIAANAYDHQSRRIRKTVGDDAHVFLYDGWNMTAEMTVDTATLATNITCYGWGLDLSGSLQGAGGVGGLLSVTTVSLVPAISLNTYYPAFDANGNVTAYLDSTSATAATFEYDAFGNTIPETVTEGLHLPFRFSTKYFDDETGIYFYGYRHYLPELGRWASRDPVGEMGGENLYRFVDNNPADRIDLLGLSGNRNNPPTQLSMPCCKGKVYGSATSCCLDGAITSRDPKRTGVYSATEYGREDPFFDKKRDWMVQHAWVEFPGGSTGFGPDGNPYWPHAGLVSYPRDPYHNTRNEDTKVYEVTLSPCDYDIQKFVDCVSAPPGGKKSPDVDGAYKTGRIYCIPGSHCETFQQDLVAKCKGKARR